MKLSFLGGLLLLLTHSCFGQYYTGPVSGPAATPAVTALHIPGHFTRDLQVYSVPFYCGTQLNTSSAAAPPVSGSLAAPGSPGIAPAYYYTTVTVYSEETSPVPVTLAAKPLYANNNAPFSASSLDSGKTSQASLPATGSGAGASYSCNDIMGLSQVPGSGTQFGDFSAGVVGGIFSIRSKGAREFDVYVHYTVLPLTGKLATD